MAKKTVRSGNKKKNKELSAEEVKVMNAQKVKERLNEIANNQNTEDIADYDCEEQAFDAGGSNFDGYAPDIDDVYENRVRNLDIGEMYAINDLRREMISIMNALSNKYLEYHEHGVIQKETGFDDDACIVMTLDTIDVHSYLNRADSIVKLMKTIVDHTMPEV